MAILLLSNSILAAIFSLLLPIQNVHSSSIISAILGLAFSFALMFYSIKLTREKTQKALKLTRFFLSYLIVVLMMIFIISRLYADKELPVMDIILGIIWFIITGVVCVTNPFLSEKRAERYFEGLTLIKEKRSVLGEIGSWVDAFIWAISHIILLNLFLFQLYEIPSESMVPTFMVGDRVVGFKLSSGPTFPMSSFRLPRLKTYHRGDVVILKSPHYPQNKENEFKALTSQAVAMITFMKVNTNIDPLTGKPKADPLVKRIVGMPGERLMLLDGVLYAKKQNDADYHVVAEDTGYAVWNINALPQEKLQLVQRIPFDQKIYETMLTVEEERKAIDFRAEYDEIEKIIRSTVLQKPSTDTATDIESFLKESGDTIIDLFRHDSEIARRIFTTNGGLTWLKRFSLSWANFWVSDKADDVSLYELRNAQLSVLVKKNFARLILRDLELFRLNATEEQFQTDAQRLMLLAEAEKYIIYTQLSNGRNMDEFPKNGYLQKNEYFLMGDNRFNSLDMRHSLQSEKVPLDGYDTEPILYLSNVFPKAVNDSSILGTASFIFWPPNRVRRVR